MTRTMPPEGDRSVRDRAGAHRVDRAPVDDHEGDAGSFDRIDDGDEWTQAAAPDDPAAAGSEVVDEPAVIVDDRLRARRIEVRRAEGRRRLLRLLVLIAVGGVAVVVTAVLRSPMLDVDRVDVVGSARADADAVRAAAGIEVGEPILLVDLGAAAAAVETLPWVAEARASRDGFDVVTVEIVERTVAAVLTSRGRTVLVDRAGQVLAPASGREAVAFVQVHADVDVPADGGTVPDDVLVAIEVADRVRTDVAGAVASVLPDPLTLRLIDGGTVQFGSAADLDAKLESLRTLFARIDTSCIDTIDLTVAEAPAVSRRSPC